MSEVQSEAARNRCRGRLRLRARLDSTRSSPRPPGAVHEMCPRPASSMGSRGDGVRGPHGCVTSAWSCTDGSALVGRVLLLRIVRHAVRSMPECNEGRPSLSRHGAPRGPHSSGGSRGGQTHPWAWDPARNRVTHAAHYRGAPQPMPARKCAKPKGLTAAPHAPYPHVRLGILGPAVVSPPRPTSALPGLRTPRPAAHALVTLTRAVRPVSIGASSR